MVKEIEIDSFEFKELVISAWQLNKLEQLWKDASAADFDEFCRLLFGESPRRKADREAWLAEYDLPKGEANA